MEDVSLMPLFDYICEKCGECFEVYKKDIKNDQVICEKCGVPAKRRFAPVGIIFKGTGFYKTDSKANFKPEKSNEPKSSSTGEEKKLEPESKSVSA